MKINTKRIAKMKPCEDRFNNWKLNHENDNLTLRQFFNLSDITHGDKIWVGVRLLTRQNLEVFAIDCSVSAEQHYAANALTYAGAVAVAGAANAAAYATNAATYADAVAYAANAAAYAANAVTYADTGAVAAAYAANAVTYADAGAVAANAAAYAAAYAVTYADAVAYAANAKQKEQEGQLEVLIYLLGDNK